MNSSTINPSLETFQVTNIFANGLTDDKGKVTDVTKIKNLMTCITKEVTKDYIDREAHLKRDYSVVIHEIGGKINEVTFWI